MALDGHLSQNTGVAEAIERYIRAICKGLLKTMSKMGISTLRSYRSAQVFQAIGLNQDLVDRYFPGTSSSIQGIGIDDATLRDLRHRGPPRSVGIAVVALRDLPISNLEGAASQRK